MKVSHLCSPSRGSGFSQSEYRLAIPPLSITTLTFLSAKNAGAPPIVIHPLLFSPASTPSSMYSAGRGNQLSAGSKIFDADLASKCRRRHRQPDCLRCGHLLADDGRDDDVVAQLRLGDRILLKRSWDRRPRTHAALDAAQTPSRAPGTRRCRRQSAQLQRKCTNGQTHRTCARRSDPRTPLSPHETPKPVKDVSVNIPCSSDFLGQTTTTRSVGRRY